MNSQQIIEKIANTETQTAIQSGEIFKNFSGSTHIQADKLADMAGVKVRYNASTDQYLFIRES